jgi:hypothetical protein
MLAALSPGHQQCFSDIGPCRDRCARFWADEDRARPLRFHLSKRLVVRGSNPGRWHRSGLPGCFVVGDRTAAEMASAGKAIWRLRLSPAPKPVTRTGGGRPCVVPIRPRWPWKTGDRLEQIAETMPSACATASTLQRPAQHRVATMYLPRSGVNRRWCDRASTAREARTVWPAPALPLQLPDLYRARHP